MLLTASTALGISAAGELSARVRDLDQLILSLKTVEWELSSRCAPIPQILRRTMSCTAGTVKEFYLLVLSRLERRSGLHFSVIWAEAAEASGLHLNERDVSLLLEAGRVLGRSDAGSQCAALSETRAALGRSLEEAREEQRRMGRVYGTLGVASGVFLTMILL